MDDEPEVESWWFDDKDQKYVKVIRVTSSNFVGEVVAVKRYDPDGTNEAGYGYSGGIWTDMVNRGDLKLVSIPPWETLEVEDPIELDLAKELEPEPQLPTCKTCGKHDFRFVKGPALEEHRWVCRKCWWTYDYKSFALIGGNAETDKV